MVDPFDTPLKRREFLKASAITGGLFLPAILHARATAAETTILSDTAVIFVMMGGGPSQFETYDPKPDAPLEIRGNYHAISTKLPGFQFCDLLPRQAAISDKFSIVRSIQHRQASHIAQHILETGYDLLNSANARAGEMPSVGSVVSKIRGVSPTGIPAYVSIPKMAAYAGPHWLGAQHKLFSIDNDPNAPDFEIKNLKLDKRLNRTRIDDRRLLRRSLDQAQSIAETNAEAKSVDSIFDQAFELIAGDEAQKAFDISHEPDSVRDRYGRNTFGQQLLLARRLAEAVVPFLKVRSKDWDDHEKLIERVNARVPEFDIALSALIEDLHERGLNRKVLVIGMGEFGRTPKINGKGGRDHWPSAMSVLLSGGRIVPGRVIGATDRNGAKVTATPYAPQNVLAMAYHHLGIDPGMTFPDYSGRPRYVLEERELIRELL